MPGKIPGVARCAHMRVGAPRTKRELHHVGTAQDHGACTQQALQNYQRTEALFLWHVCLGETSYICIDRMLMIETMI